MEPLNQIDVALIQRALSLPEMARFADQVVAICHKLGLPEPEWAGPEWAGPQRPVSEPGHGS